MIFRYLFEGGSIVVLRRGFNSVSVLRRLGG